MDSRIAAVLILVGLGGGPTGCAPNRNVFGDLSTPYHKALNSMTRERSFFDVDQVKYLTTVTYETKELQQAYVEEYAKRYELPPDKKNEMLARQLAETRDYDVFFVSHFTSDRKSARITADPNVWRLTLSNDPSGQTVEEPFSVTPMTSNDPVLQYFHPYVTHWSKTFRVKFKSLGEGPYRQLRMTGVVAQLAFVWNPP
ncbi:MAG TPA: hypothetical protein VI895_09845 [Bdellovibrionota bacterium]|nr:hypothetical protein [Bdellovibrionota bacterium]